MIGAGALVVAAAAPAGAQDPLGFGIDQTAGITGEVVTGHVDVTDVAAHCTTDLGAFQARFAELTQLLDDIFPPSFAERFFPDLPNTVYTDADQLAYVLVLLASFGIAQNINGAAEDALPQTFVMTFADIATQQPVGDLGSFDPATGEGSVTVPDIQPGLWAVAAACVGPPVDDLDQLEAGIRGAGAVLEQLGVPFGPDGPGSPEFLEFAQDYLDTDATGIDLLIEFVSAIGPRLLRPIMVPEGLGVQLFTVLADPEDMIAEVQGLVAGGQLSDGYAQGLIEPLQNAARSLDSGDVEAACDQLDGVADRNIPQNILDPEAAGELIGQVETLQAHLACT
jgi:hypothetical protein